MSKIKAKDLTFDASQPAFLQRLRRQIAGDDSARHEIPIPRNKRLAHDDEEDAPTYVLEDTNQSLTKAEYDALVAGKDGKQDDAAKSDDDGGIKTGEAQKQPKDNIAEVGHAAKKRKAAKVIVGDEQEDEADGGKAAAKAVNKPKKKAKKVKLSFGDQEEG